MKCLKCGSETVIDNARVMDRGDANSDAGPLTLVLYEDPKAWFFPGQHKFPLNAHVCCSCGFTELYAADPAALLEVSRRVPPQQS
jgi:predicted nucleic-acid-binding Zn-ribbon protein